MLERDIESSLISLINDWFSFSIFFSLSLLMLEFILEVESTLLIIEIEWSLDTDVLSLSMKESVKCFPFLSSFFGDFFIFFNSLFNLLFDDCWIRDALLCGSLLVNPSRELVIPSRISNILELSKQLFIFCELLVFLLLLLLFTFFLFNAFSMLDASDSSFCGYESFW